MVSRYSPGEGVLDFTSAPASSARYYCRVGQLLPVREAVRANVETYRDNPYAVGFLKPRGDASTRVTHPDSGQRRLSFANLSGTGATSAL